MAFTDYIPIIGDAINLAGGFMSNHANAKENQKNREWSEHMWHLNNEYNLPVNQIQRFRDAGLSAALAYGQGTSSLAQYAGNMPASRGYENPAKNIDTAAIAQLHIQDKVANSQISLQGTEASKNQTEAKKNEATTENLEWDNIIKSQTYETVIKTSEENLNKLRNENKISEKEYEIKMQELDKAKELVREARERANKAAEEVQTQKAETAYIQEKTNTEKSQQQFLSASAQKALAEGYAARQQGDYYKSASLLNKAMAATEEYKRREISSNIKTNSVLRDKLVSEAGLNATQAQNLVVQMSEAIENNKVDRFTKTVTQRYGTGVLGVITGAVFDELGISTGANTVNSHLGVNKNVKNALNPLSNSIEKEAKKRGYIKGKNNKWHKRKK